MGIPKFARFLINRYPLILKKIKDERDIPEIDNLYLDINGIIHKIAHNNSLFTMCQTRTIEEIYYDIFCYIDRLVHLIKPKKMLMISADGVAPRAKMNQQRSRRYRKNDVDPKEKEALRKQGIELSQMFNSDAISAGTEFMFNLSHAFDDFIKSKQKVDPLWRNILILLTGSDVPGEGEHKIIEYVRNFKNSQNYDNNTRHCVYGLDADLIMLSLITHEPNMLILREEAFTKKKKASESIYRSSLSLIEPFEFIYISIVREYLELEFLQVRPYLKFEFNIERIIDDFIFFCFFIGNDFLPNLNTLDIDHGALDDIFIFYRDVLPSLNNYITYHGKIDFKSAEKIFHLLAKQELINLNKMLAKVAAACKENKKKKQRMIEDKKKFLKMKKLTTLKENFLVKLKENDEAFLINFKKNKIKNKINSYKEKYEKEMTSLGKTDYQFEEDVKNYMKDELNKNIKKIHKKIDEDPIDVGGIFSSDNIAEDEPNNQISMAIDPKVKPEVDPKAIAQLFNSDEEELPGVEEPKKGVVLDSLTNIIKEVSKFHTYIADENYCSDVNIDDIDENDVGNVSDPEIVEDPSEAYNEEINEVQDMDQVFQMKLIEYYITDVNKAKAFYYKEKLHIDIETPEGQEEQKQMFRKYIEGLQWVMYYYYRGVQSWRWYYPYFYPPMISDFNQIKEFLDYDMDRIFYPSDSQSHTTDTDTSFTNHPPFEPFQSLLFILPRTSKNLIPQCYWSIYDDLPHLFPDHFKIDFNGKKMPWESIVLLPFLEEQVIMEYEAQKRSGLTVTEIERNQHGTSYCYTFDKQTNNVVRSIYEVYDNNTRKKICNDSNYNPKQVHFAFPSMKSINYDFCIDSRKSFQASHAIKRNTVIAIRPVLNTDMINEEFIITSLQKKTIFVNYPFKSEATLLGVFYNNVYYYINGNNVLWKDNKYRISNEVRESIKKEWYKKGVNFDYCHVLCNVAPFKKLVRGNDGALIRLYEENGSYFVPIEITSMNSHLRELDNLLYNQKKKFENIETDYNKEDYCVILSKAHFGSIAQVENYVYKNHVRYDKLNDENYKPKLYDSQFNYDLDAQDWQVPLDWIYKGPLLEMVIKNSFQSSLVIDPNFAHNIIQNTNEAYSSMEELSKTLGISVWSLGLITSSIYVINCTNEDCIAEDSKLSELEHWNIGLNMKLRTKFEKLVLPGYTRYIQGYGGDALCWEFSKSAVDLINQYKEKYPFVFECLEKYKSLYNRSNKFFKVYEIFSTLDDLSTKLTDIAVWINSLPLSKMKFSNNRSDYLSKFDCHKIEEYVLTKNNSTAQLKGQANLSKSMVLNPGYVFQESSPWIPPFMSHEPYGFQLGDRVVNIRSEDITFVPFGEKGTVTGVSNNFIEVMFDNEFPGGCTCNDRFSSRKGAYVRTSNLINLTNKFPVYLRRNTSKYKSWNFEPSQDNYDGLWALYGSTQDDVPKKKQGGKETNKGGMHIIRQGSDVIPLKEADENINLDIDKSHSVDPLNPFDEYRMQFENKPTPIGGYSNKFDTTGVTFTSNSSNAMYNPNLPQKNIMMPDNKNLTSKEYVPKKIIVKHQAQICSQFKTYPEGVKITSQMEMIQFESHAQSRNCSEYRKNRIFTNENIGSMRIYYYTSCKDNQDTLRGNTNIIISDGGKKTELSKDI